MKNNNWFDFSDYLDDEETTKLPTLDNIKVKQRPQTLNTKNDAWVNKSSSISFTRDQRFKMQKSTFQDQPLNISNSFVLSTQRGCNFGYGKRSQFYSNTVKKSKMLPSPFDYFKEKQLRSKCHKCKKILNKQIPINTDRNIKCTFGMSYEKYQKVAIGNYNNYQTLNHPPVGSYNIKLDSVKRRTPQVRLVGKGKMFNTCDLSKSLSPLSYKPNYKLVNTSRNRSPNQGYGKKIDFSKPLNYNPGPGAYFLNEGYNQKSLSYQEPRKTTSISKN